MFARCLLSKRRHNGADRRLNSVRTVGGSALCRVACGCALVLPLALPAQTLDGARNARPLITQTIVESRLHALEGNTRPEATADHDRGPVTHDFALDHMLLQLRRSPGQETAFDQYLEDVQNLKSPDYHQWLTAAQIGERFGPAAEDIQTVTRWLESHGFTVNNVQPSGMVIDFSGNAGEVAEAFHTEIHELEVNGQRHVANMSDPEIPEALAPAVAGVVSMHDFTPHSMRRARPEYTFTSGGTPYQTVVPADLATIYNLNPLFSAGVTGKGQTIAVIEDTDLYSSADWTTFRGTFGLSSYSSGSLATVHPAPASGKTNCADPGVNSDDVEAILDAEWASAAAPNAAIQVAACANTRATFGGFIAMQNMINASAHPSVISISYGECEAENGATSNAAINALYKQAAGEGISVFVSAGDEGAASCDAGASTATHGIGVSAYASTPYNVAVGGTDFADAYQGTTSNYWNTTNSSTYGSAKSYVPEIPWNDSCASVLLSSYFGYSTPYGATGFCNSSTANSDGLLVVAGGSGGPSGCATGSPSTSGVVSGSCAGYAKPSWQVATGNPSDRVRDIPDVSLFAADGVWGHYYVFCFSDPRNGGAACTGAPSGWAGAGGTSFASPILAGIQALVNQKYGAQGNPNPTYYHMAATTTGVFHDVTLGDMDVNCTGTTNCYDSTTTSSGGRRGRSSSTQGVLSTSSSSYAPAYGTTSSWDFATGLGSVDATQLVNNWGK